MTERCQTKFLEKFDNINYIIYGGVLVGSIAVLCFYRFHFATIVISYVLGCLACYYGLNSNILHKYVHQLKCHFNINPHSEPCKDATDTGCATCGSERCNRHDPSKDSEPWTGLRIHKQLDQAIEDFYNTILEQFINSWYSKITLQPFFVDELRHQLRYASACLLKRAVKINYARFITTRLIPCALRHYTVCSNGGTLLDSKMAVHPAAANRNAELKYLRSITNAIMPYLLKNGEVQNDVFRVLIREIFSGWVLLPLSDALADPRVLNALVIEACERNALPTADGCDYQVEFLETFVRQSDSVYTQRSKLLRLDLEYVVNDQEHFYAFMQYLKTTCHLRLLQFYKDIKNFQLSIITPSLSAEEARRLHAMSQALVSTEGELADELRALAGESPESVLRLQTSRALYEASRQSHAVLEKIILPRFLHSEEFYKLMIGSRVLTGYQKQMAKKPHEKLLTTALKLGTRLKGAIKSQTLDGRVFESMNLEDSDGDGVENVDILKYLESTMDEGDHDLSTYKVVLTHVETRLQAPPRRGSVRVFTLYVHRADADAGGGGARLWALERSEHDFHLLRAKLDEFHGQRQLQLAPPSRRDNSPLETLRYKYEDFLQRLLQKPLLQNSELLRLFLTEDGDFSLVVQASTLNAANNSDLTNIYQSVAHRLRKEKGQHLESFLRNFLVSSDMERYQALKHGTKDVEEALEVIEDTEIENVHERRQNNTRNIHDSIFLNNFDMEPTVYDCGSSYQTTVIGFTQCFMYLLTKVFRVRGFISGILGTLLGLIKDVVDDVFDVFLNYTLCDLLNERRLAHLIRLGHSLLFGKRALTPRSDAHVLRERAKKELLSLIPTSVSLVTGGGLPLAINTAFELVQRPELNKQLVYNLLDLCIVEIFPELAPLHPIKN